MDRAILLVDDIEDNRITLALRLETCGYSKLIMAANGREALEKMRGASGPCSPRYHDARHRRL